MGMKLTIELIENDPDGRPFRVTVSDADGDRPGDVLTDILARRSMQLIFDEVELWCRKNPIEY